MPISHERLLEAARRVGAELMHSDDDLDQKLEVVTPEYAGPEAGPSNDELIENSHTENGQSPVLDGDIRPPERANVNAIREVIETQAEMEVGKPIEEKQEEIAAQGDGDKKQVTVDGGGGKTIIINIAAAAPRENWQCLDCGAEGELSTTGKCQACGSDAVSSVLPAPPEYARHGIEAGQQGAQKAQGIGGEKHNPRADVTSNAGVGAFGGTSLSGTPNMEKHAEQPDYKKLRMERDQIISQNRSHRMKGLPALPVPSKPEVPMVPVAYAADGTYEGRLEDAADCPPGCHVKWEPMKGASYHEIKEAFVNKTAGTTIEDVRTAGREYLKSVRTAAITVSQGVDDKGDHMLINMNGREYVLYGQDAESFRREYAAIKKPEAAVNALVEKYLWKMQPYKKPVIQHPPAQTQQDPNSYDLRRQRAEGLADSDAYWEGKEKNPNAYKQYMQQHASQKGKLACLGAVVAAAQDYFGYDNWVTGHTALMINNDPSGLTTLHNLVRNALKKGLGAKQLGGQFARIFKKFGDQTKKYYEENAGNARDARGKHEREQLEGVVKEPSDDKARDFVDNVTNMWYDAGGKSDWEEPSGEINWEAIAEGEMEAERSENPDKYQQPKEKGKEQGIHLVKKESLKSACAIMKKIAGIGVADKHQLRIAIDSLKMPDAMLGVMGGPSKEEALQILAKHGLRWDDADYMAGGKGVKKANKVAKRYRLYTGPTIVRGTAEELRKAGLPVSVEGTEAVIFESNAANAEQATSQLRGILGDQWGVKGVSRLAAVEIEAKTMSTVTEKKAGEGTAKTPEEIEKEAGFNFFFPGQALREIAPELQHEIVDYPNATNTPMEYADISGDAYEVPEEVAIAAALEGAMNPTIIAYVSTSPAAAAGIGRDGKTEVLEGAPLRKENDIRGMMFTDEFYGQQEAVPGKAFASLAKRLAATEEGKLFGSAFAYLNGLKKTAGADEAKQFSIFLKKVCGEIAATFVGLFKVMSRPMLDKVPGKGEIQLAQVEQPQGLSSFNIYNTSSRVKYLMDKLTDSEIKDAINGSSAQGAVWHDGEDGGYVYEVFVRIDDIDTESLIATYSFICGTKE